MLGIGLGSASIECCDDIVRDELLLDRFPEVEVRSWLCLRARGTGGGIFFCGGGISAGTDISLVPDGADVFSYGVICWVLIWSGAEAMTGVGGRGLFTSELSLGRVIGEDAGSVAAKLSNDTTCGCLCATSLPCRCLGAGGGFFFPFFTSDTRPILSSPSDSAISYEVLGDSG